MQTMEQNQAMQWFGNLQKYLLEIWDTFFARLWLPAPPGTERPPEKGSGRRTWHSVCHRDVGNAQLSPLGAVLLLSGCSTL